MQPDAASASAVFDWLTQNEPGASDVRIPGWDPSLAWQVVGRPGAALPASGVASGDLVVQRALGEGRLASLRVVGEDVAPHALFAAGRLRRDVLVLRPRADAVGGSAREDAPGAGEELGSLDVAGTQLAVRTRDELPAASLDAALAAALAAPGASAIRGPWLRAGAARVCRWVPSTRVPAALPSVIACSARATDLCAVVLRGAAGPLLYVPAQAVATGAAQRWVAVPDAAAFYGLPAREQARFRERLTRALTQRPIAGLGAAELAGLSMPALRVAIAQHAETVFPVTTVRRGDPPTDRGGVVNGVTPAPVPYPAVEPACYLPVISEREGKLESINAWDAGAGISLGPIQINAHGREGGAHTTLSQLLWQLVWDDPALFQQAFGALRWGMTRDPEGAASTGEHAVRLHVGSEHTLRSALSERERWVRYLHTGNPTRAGVVPRFRRDLAARFRSLVVWPHVQQRVVEVSARWLEPALAHLAAAGVPALDPARPDRDTFVLRAIACSLFVRYSAYLRPFLHGLRGHARVSDKLAHWQESLAAIPGISAERLRELRERLTHQVSDATRVHAAILALAPAPAAPPGESAMASGAAAAPAATAPHILGFRATGELVSSPLALRTTLADKAVSMLRQLDDLGIGDQPAGRRGAYVDAIAWGESAAYRTGLQTCPTDGNGACINSSCALLVRSLWRLLGARSPQYSVSGPPPGSERAHLLDPPYAFGSAMSVLVAFAKKCGAYVAVGSHADFVRADPQPGDAIFLTKGTSQHVFTVVERSGERFVSIDGGQSGGSDGGCCGIRRRTRVLVRQGGGVSFQGEPNQRPITGVAKLGRLRFDAPLIDVQRHPPRA